MAFLTRADDETLTPAQREMLDKAGALEPLLAMLAHRPAVMEQLMRLVAATFDAPDGLPVVDRLIVAIATARAVGSERLVETYGAALREAGLEEEVVTALCRDFRLAELSARQRALLDFAMVVTDDVHLVGKVSVDALRTEAGLSEADVVDAVQVTALVGQLGRLVIALGADA